MLTSAHLINQICYLAKTQDKPGLQKFLAQHQIAVNVRHREKSAIHVLAKENEQAAVNFLLHHFSGSLGFAAFGYAAGGHRDQAHALVENKAVGASVVLRGYAFAGYSKEANELIATDPGYFQVDAIYSYAAGGHKDQVKELIRQWIMCYAASGYAFFGESEEVDKLVSEGKEEYRVIDRYALGGHIACVEKLLTPDLIDLAAAGYAQGGFIDNANELVERGASKLDVLLNFARGGYIGQVNTLLQYFQIETCPTSPAHNYSKAALNRAVCGYAMGGHIAQVNAMLNLGADVEKAYKGYYFHISNYYQGSLSFLSYLLALTDNVALREKLVAHQLLLPLSGEERKSLLAQAKKVYNVIQAYSLNYRQAQVMADLKPDICCWLVDAPALVQEGRLPKDIYYAISTKLCNLEEIEIESLRQAVSSYLFKKVKENYLSQFGLWCKTKKEMAAEKKFMLDYEAKLTQRSQRLTLT